MKADVAFTALLAAARALKPYTRGWSAHSRVLHLHACGDTLTVTATTGDDTAQVDLPGAVADGWCAMAPDPLITALTAMKPAGKAARTATVTLHADADQFHVTVGSGPTLDLPTATAPDAPLALPGPHGGWRPVATATVADWCDLVTAVGAAASTPTHRPELAVVRLHRDSGAALLVEASDTYRAHRATWGHPAPGAVDVRMSIEAATRATKLLRAGDPHGHVHIDTDIDPGSGLIRWSTDRVRVYAYSRGGHFPDLERIREATSADADVRFVVDRAQLLAVLDTAVALTTGVRYSLVQILPNTQTGIAEVVVYPDASAPVYRSSIRVGDYRGPTCTLTFHPLLARHALALLAGPTVTVDAVTDGLAVHLHSHDRHALVMQVATS